VATSNASTCSNSERSTARHPLPRRDVSRSRLCCLSEAAGVSSAWPGHAEQGQPWAPAPEPGGSNGFAIAPKHTLNGNALLLINPHTSFYFRSELQMVSDEGLNAYGAVTWGQFFIYQGFNERAGWMHTSSGVDNIDWFLETPVSEGRPLVLPLRRP
jgi:acyl-homoserine-lactone acylase